MVAVSEMVAGLLAPLGELSQLAGTRLVLS